MGSNLAESEIQGKRTYQLSIFGATVDGCQLLWALVVRVPVWHSSDGLTGALGLTLAKVALAFCGWDGSCSHQLLPLWVF